MSHIEGRTNDHGSMTAVPWRTVGMAEEDAAAAAAAGAVVEPRKMYRCEEVVVVAAAADTAMEETPWTGPLVEGDAAGGSRRAYSCCRETEPGFFLLRISDSS